MVVSPVNQVWPKSYCKAQCEREEDKADIKRSGKTASANSMPGVRQVQESSGRQRRMEEACCEIVFGTPTTLAVKGSVKEGEQLVSFILIKNT